MSEITSTNVRLGPGTYLLLKSLSEKSGMSIGTWANFLIGVSLFTIDKDLAGFPQDIKAAIIADMMSSIGELFKAVGMEAIRNTSIADLYKKLLSS